MSLLKTLATPNGKSKPFVLDEVDWKKLGYGFLIAIAATVITHWEQEFTSLDFGDYQEIAWAVNAFLVNFVRKWLADNGIEVPEEPAG